MKIVKIFLENSPFVLFLPNYDLLPLQGTKEKEEEGLYETLYLIFDYPYKYYTFKLFEV